MRYSTALVFAALVGCATDLSAPGPDSAAQDASQEAATDAPVTDTPATDGGDAGAILDAAADTSAPDAPRDAAPVDSAVVCPAGMTWCGAFCSALDTIANCGGCGVACCPPSGCTATGGTVVCVSGACAVACDRSHLNCDGIGDCETPVGNANCGGCGRRCEADQTCAEGRQCCPRGPGGDACRRAALDAG